MIHLMSTMLAWRSISYRAVTKFLAALIQLYTYLGHSLLLTVVDLEPSRPNQTKIYLTYHSPLHIYLRNLYVMMVYFISISGHFFKF